MISRAIAFSCVILLCLSMSVSTHAYPKSYIGLYASDSHDSWCAPFYGPMQYVDIWVWCLPGDNGMICAEFLVEYPPNIVPATITYNPLVMPAIDPPPSGGYSLCLVDCQWDWVWLFHRQLLVMDAVKSAATIVPLPEAGAYQFANCLPGYPTEPCTPLTNLYINYEGTESECMGTSVGGASWGAIKSLVE